MQTTGQAWLVLDLTGSAAALGVVTTLQFLPVTVLTLFGGVFADRFPKRPILFSTQVVALVQALVLGTLVVTGNVELWHVYALSFVLGVSNALDNPPRQAFVPELVGREHLVNAVALNSMTFNGARVVGPALGGIAIATVGLGVVFFVNAASFVAVLVGYLIMRASEFRSVPARAGGTSVLSDVKGGLRYAMRVPTVAFVFIVVGFLGTFGYKFTLIVPLVAEFILKVGPGEFGLLMSSLGVGSLGAAFVGAGLRKPSPVVLVTGATGFSVLFALMAMSPWHWATAGILVALGASGMAFTTTANATLQMSVPDEYRGRILSIYILLFAGSTPIGAYFTGEMSELIGVRPTLLIDAALCGTGVALAVAYRRWRGAEHHAREPELEMA